MVIAVMSDLHDNVANWELLHPGLTQAGVSVLINCGDTCAPAMLKEMSQTFPGQIHTVFGNVADRAVETEVAATLDNVVHHQDRGEVSLDGRKIFFNHFPQVATAMVRRGGFDLVCYGHTHLKRWEKINDTFLLNPGTAGGMFQYPSYALVDLTTMTGEFIEIKV